VAGALGGMPGAPGVLRAEEAARAALHQIHRRSVVRVPNLVYRITAASARFLPRALLRRLSGRMHRRAGGER